MSGPVRLAVYSNGPFMGGAELALGGLLAALHPRFEVTVLGPDREVVEALAQRRPGSRYAVLPQVEHKWDVRSMLRFARTLRAARPDILQLTLTTPWGLRWETMIGVLMGQRVIAAEMLPLEAHHERYSRLKRMYSRPLAAHVGAGELAAREVERLAGLPAGSIRAIPLGVEEFSVRRDGDGRERPRLGTIARLDRQKGLDVLLHALAEVPGVDLEIVGDGPEREPLAALATECGVADRVRFAGWSDDSRAWFTRWDAFVLPSRYEGLPLAILDAMLAEMPIVATDVGSVSEAIVSGDTGLLIAPDDVTALAGALRTVVEDQAAAERLGRRARAVALERYTSDVMARRYEELYDEVLAG